jgi:hypothetical protein
MGWGLKNSQTLLLEVVTAIRSLVADPPDISLAKPPSTFQQKVM